MRFFYLRNKHGHPVGCLASQLKDDVVQFAVSVCNPLDQFKRDHARALAAGRLFTGEFEGFSVDRGNVKRNIMEMVASSSSYPQRARDAAKLWLSTQVNKETA